MDLREKLIELLNDSFAKQYEKRGLLTAPHTATDLIEKGVTVQEWIPVTERLPDDEKDAWSLCRIVRVLMYDGATSIGYCNRGLRMWFHLPALGTTFVGHSFEKTPVVAWMPLPEPPKEE